MWRMTVFVFCVFAVSYANGLNTVHNFLFATDLIPPIGEHYRGKNAIVSPISVQTILTLASMGSKGETLDELRKVAHLDSYEDRDAILSDYKQFFNVIENATPQRIHFANHIYLGKDYALHPLFNEIADYYLHSGVDNVDFSAQTEAAQKINEWVAAQTKNKIENIIDAATLDSDTALVLVNAVYFKSPWAKQFDVENTEDGDFYVTATDTKKVQMMRHDVIEVSHCESNEFDVKAVQLPFKNSELKMVILLPNKKDGLSELQKHMTIQNIEKLNSTCKLEKVSIQLPKFKVNFSTSLKDVLQKLGMKKSFSSVDFSDMLEPDQPPLHISDVIHKAFINVDEAGVEAGASTAVPVLARMGREANLDFIVDHPFAYSIQDNSAIYFIGQVFNPTL